MSYAPEISSEIGGLDRAFRPPAPLAGELVVGRRRASPRKRSGFLDGNGCRDWADCFTCPYNGCRASYATFKRQMNQDAGCAV